MKLNLALALVCVASVDAQYCSAIKGGSVAGTCFGRCQQVGRKCDRYAAPSAPVAGALSPALNFPTSGFLSSAIPSSFPSTFSISNTLRRQAAPPLPYSPMDSSSWNVPALPYGPMQSSSWNVPSLPYSPLQSSSWNVPSLPYSPAQSYANLQAAGNFPYYLPYGVSAPAPVTAPAPVIAPAPISAPAPLPVFNNPVFGSSISPQFAANVAAGALNTAPFWSPAVGQFAGGLIPPLPVAPEPAGPPAPKPAEPPAPKPADPVPTKPAVFGPSQWSAVPPNSVPVFGVDADLARIGCDEATVCSCDSGCEVRGDCCFDYCAFCVA
mmetsp:Transcript_31403/g.61200  ORF Transcript_31403/g.61200 Transcript_31403/m.61200 type:complete len:324 (-) Transcript_31403:515-1486(-)|eukprot:CAMPEP_0175095290 /NCGR_PEP_ID=MMETSP0086_2-20121207/4068_1 /TAXON_ID=136419 /ORGANISM="Unknown Unknown, Strain D1" /LENGTH=323 /DNA_ID=CAMNT_0016368511 /DNA_START=34 /DNA_END=1005 /DNA_ORIENTATION=+